MVSDFSSFPIGNPKQQQHNNSPAFPKSQRSIYGSKNPFSGSTIQPLDIWNELQQNNLPEGLQKGPPIFPPILKSNLPEGSRKSIFGSKNLFSGPTIQPPDIWKQLQQNNLPTFQGPSIFPPPQYYNFPKKF
jgi:hypothetical protein